MRRTNFSSPVVAAGLLSLASLASVLFLAHCSLVTSLDGLSGGDTSASDAASAAVSTSPDGQAAPAVPALDAQSSDAPSVAPLGADSSSGDDGSSLSSAADDGGTVLFADDFEGSDPLPRQWDLMATADGTLVLDSSLFVSPATSLRATAFSLDAGAAGNAANVTLRKLFPMPSAGTTVAYDFFAFPKDYDQAANAVIGALQISDGAGDLYELQLDVQRNAAGALGVVFAEYTGLDDGGSNYIGHPVSGALAVEAWTHVRIALDLTQPPVARVYFNDVLELETSITLTIQGTAIQISLGLSYVSAPSDSWVVNYDDVAFRILP